MPVLSIWIISVARRLIAAEIEHGLFADKPIKGLMNPAVRVLDIGDGEIALRGHPEVTAGNMPTVGILIEHLRIDICIKASPRNTVCWGISKDALKADMRVFGFQRDHHIRCQFVKATVIPVPELGCSVFGNRALNKLVKVRFEIFGDIPMTEESTDDGHEETFEKTST